MEHNDTTPLGLPLPHPDNALEVDVMRLRALGNATDEKLQEVLGGIEERVATVNGQAGPDVVLRREHLALGPANGPTVSAVVYNPDGTVREINETLDGASCKTELSYNGDGTVHTISTTFRGRKRTETVSYDAGNVTGITATEVPA